MTTMQIVAAIFSAAILLTVVLIVAIAKRLDAKKLPPYRLDVITPLDEPLFARDDGIALAVGRQSDASGAGPGGRDINWWFFTEAERDSAAERVSAMGDPVVRVVRRLDIQ